MEDFILFGFAVCLAFSALKWVAVTWVLPAALKVYFWLSLCWDFLLNSLSFLWRISPWLAAVGIGLWAFKKLLSCLRSKFRKLETALTMLQAENEKTRNETQRLDQLIVSLQKRCDAIAHYVTKLEVLAASLQAEIPMSTQEAQSKPSKPPEPKGSKGPKGDELIRNVLNEFKRGY